MVIGNYNFVLYYEANILGYNILRCIGNKAPLLLSVVKIITLSTSINAPRGIFLIDFHIQVIQLISDFKSILAVDIDYRTTVMFCFILVFTNSGRPLIRLIPPPRYT